MVKVALAQQQVAPECCQVRSQASLLHHQLPHALRGLQLTPFSGQPAARSGHKQRASYRRAWPAGRYALPMKTPAAHQVVHLGHCLLKAQWVEGWRILQRGQHRLDLCLQLRAQQHASGLQSCTDSSRIEMRSDSGSRSADPGLTHLSAAALHDWRCGQQRTSLDCMPMPGSLARCSRCVRRRCALPTNSICPATLAEMSSGSSSSLTCAQLQVCAALASSTCGTHAQAHA